MNKVLCLDDQRELFFSAETGYEAMQKLVDYLNLSHQDNNAKIELHNGRTWSVVHNGKTYSCLV